jgi:hypothetical protein
LIEEAGDPGTDGTGGRGSSDGGFTRATGGQTISGSGGSGSTGGSVGNGGSAGSGGSGGTVWRDGGSGGTSDAGSFSDGATVPCTDAGPLPSYEGEVPQYDGPPVGPEVVMNCPGDPTDGWTEYKDVFRVEHPYDVPANTRFSIECGVYNFWVRETDKPHSVDANGRDPRTEARWGLLVDKATSGEFRTGMRMWSADVFLESTTDDSVLMQLHTTADGVGPVYLVRRGPDIPPIRGSSVPGGLVNTWFNLKVAFTAATLQSQLYVNNCLKATITGVRGDGNFYFKNGVYHCSEPVCRDHFKNIHFYRK